MMKHSYYRIIKRITWIKKISIIDILSIRIRLHLHLYTHTYFLCEKACIDKTMFTCVGVRKENNGDIDSLHVEMLS